MYKDIFWIGVQIPSFILVAFPGNFVQWILAQPISNYQYFILKVVQFQIT